MPAAGKGIRLMEAEVLLGIADRRDRSLTVWRIMELPFCFLLMIRLYAV